MEKKSFKKIVFILGFFLLTVLSYGQETKIIFRYMCKKTSQMSEFPEPKKINGNGVLSSEKIIIYSKETTTFSIKEVLNMADDKNEFLFNCIDNKGNTVKVNLHFRKNELSTLTILYNTIQILYWFDIVE